MGFSYNDITSKSMGLKARLTSWQVSGSLRNFTTTVPGKYGVTDFGADFDYREIVVSCNIFPRHSFSALVSTLDDIAAWLDPVGGLKQLVLGRLPLGWMCISIRSQIWMGVLSSWHRGWAARRYPSLTLSRRKRTSPCWLLHGSVPKTEARRKKRAFTSTAPPGIPSIR